MPNQKEENLKEGTGFRDAVKAEVKRCDQKYDFGEIEQKVDELDKKINAPIGEGTEDQEGPLTIGRKIDRNFIRPDRRSIRYPLTPEEKIQLMGMLFPIGLGDKVRNKLGEDGIVEMVGVDHRGALYLTMYKDQNLKWESEAQIKKTYMPGPIGIPPGPDKTGTDEPYVAKTDIPDPEKTKREHIVGDRKSELE